jgi:hypothetical protein
MLPGRCGVASGTLLPVIRPATRPPAAPLRHRLAGPLVALPVVLLVAALSALPVPAVPDPPADALRCPGAAPQLPGPAPGAPDPDPPVPGPPVGERSPTAGGGAVGCPQAPVVHMVGQRALDQWRPPEASIVWRRSRALGRPNHGRLVRGVELPAAGSHFVTVNPVTGKGRNPAWRRYGTDRLVRVVLRVAAASAAAHLDADVFYPRRDGRERIPTRVAQIDRRLAQELVRRFVRAGAQYVFVGPRTGLHGPPKVVMALANHDDHLHVRIRPGSRR